MKKTSFTPFSIQQGQATTEFVVALLVMVPIFLGIYYFARYSDVKHSAIQASRYTAFERSLDPFYRAKTDVQLREETRARFFTVLPNNNNGEIKFRDTTASINADTQRISFWSDAEYGRLLQNFTDVDIRTVAAGNLNDGVVSRLQNIASSAFSLPAGGIIRSEVTVPLNNIANFDALKNIDIAVPGATAIGAGSWNASGAKGTHSVCARVVPTVLADRVKTATDILGALMSPFEKNTPDMGITLPDYVPPGSVRRNNPASTPVPYPNQSPNRC